MQYIIGYTNDPITVEVNSCPVCGTNPEVRKPWPYSDFNTEAYVTCPNCELSVDVSEYGISQNKAFTMAIYEWNSKPNYKMKYEKALERIKELESEIETLKYDPKPVEEHPKQDYNEEMICVKSKWSGNIYRR